MPTTLAEYCVSSKPKPQTDSYDVGDFYVDDYADDRDYPMDDDDDEDGEIYEDDEEDSGNGET